MQLTEAFLKPGKDSFARLIGTISIGKLKTYRLYEQIKTRARLNKLNTDSLRRTVPALWTRLEEGDQDLANDMAQAVLICHMEMIIAVLDFLAIPHENGFFAKGLEVKQYLADGWEQRVYDQFRAAYPEIALLFYINHLGWEVTGRTEPFLPA